MAGMNRLKKFLGQFPVVRREFFSSAKNTQCVIYRILKMENSTNVNAEVLHAIM